MLTGCLKILYLEKMKETHFIEPLVKVKAPELNPRYQ